MRTPTTPTRNRTRTPTTPTRTQTQTTRSDAALRRALEPVEPEAFLAEHWERRPLHVERDEAGRYDDLLSLADAERLLTEPGLRYPGFRLVRAGDRLPPSSYTEDVSWRPAAFTGTADVRRVLAEWEAGATVVLQGLHLNWAPLARYCRALEAFLGHPAQANAYLTPRQSQGLPVHHDTHDVLVLQVSGRKRWQVWEPVLELPLRHQRYSPELGEPGELVLDAELAPGDTLYLPRGWLHQALTSSDDSLHLTVGINVITWLDAFRAALDRLEGDVELRRSLPEGGEGAADLLARLAERLRPGEVAAAARERLVRTRRPVLDGQLTQLRLLDELAADTTVERRPTVVAELLEDGDGLALAFEGRRVWFPAYARAEVESIFAAEEAFRACDLPGRLDEPGRLVLVRRLVREGFLRIV